MHSRLYNVFLCACRFMLGDGVWEGMRLHRGVLLFVQQHMDRLFEAAAAIDMDIGRAVLCIGLIVTLLRRPTAFLSALSSCFNIAPLLNPNRILLALQASHRRRWWTWCTPRWMQTAWVSQATGAWQQQPHIQCTVQCCHVGLAGCPPSHKHRLAACGLQGRPPTCTSGSWSRAG